MGAFLLIAVGFFLSSVGLLHATDGRRGSGVLLAGSGLLLLAFANGLPLPIPSDDEGNPVGWILLVLASVVLLRTMLRPHPRPAPDAE